MAFTLPNFNLPVNIWRSGAIPPNPPAVVTMGNLSPGKRVMVQWWDWDVSGPGPVLFMVLLLPKQTDVRGWNDPVGEDLLEVPAGSARYYGAQMVDDIGKGFSNEHRFVVMEQASIWPQPVP